MEHPSEPPRILIAVPSTGRPTARGCIASLQQQVASTQLNGCRATVVVFLNNVEPGVDTGFAGADVRTCVVDADGIADVRNTMVDFAVREGHSHVLFFDDDQVACGDWLRDFLAALRSGEFDVLLGPVGVAFPPGAPRWATDNPHLFRGSDQPPTDGPYRGHPYSGNTLIALASPALAGVRFSATLNAGGEDTYFFHRLRQRGATVRWIAGARAVEVQQAGRLTVRGLAHRRFAQGRTARRLERLGVFDGLPSPVRHTARVAARLVSVVVSLATLKGAVGPLLEALFEICFVAGVCGEEIANWVERLEQDGAR